MKFSPTTIIGYARLFCALVIIPKPLYDFYTIPNWDATKETVIALGALALVNGVLSAVAGHFTADNPPGPKANDSTQQ